MGEKINGGRSTGKEFADSSFQLPDLNPNTPPTTTTHHDLILQDFLTSSSACEDQPNSAHHSGEQVNQPLNRPPSLSQVMYANAPCFLSALNSPFEALAAPTSSTTTFLDPFLKKSCSEDHNCFNDRRYKRMMKNRESAARSRARRMAYTIELEKNKKQLQDENAMLRRALQRQERLSAVAAAIEEEPPQKRNLCRSLSAPF